MEFNIKNVSKVLLVLGIFLSFPIYVIYDSAKSSRNIKAQIGKSIIINKDTLVIMSRDHWGNNYILSNGVSIDINYAIKNIIEYK